MDAPGRLIIRRPGQTNRRPLKPVFLKLFGLGRGWRTFSRARACLNCGSFAEKLFRAWKPEFTSTNFRLFQWRLSAPCRLAPLAASQLAHPLVRPCLLVTSMWQIWHWNHVFTWNATDRTYWCMQYGLVCGINHSRCLLHVNNTQHKEVSVFMLTRCGSDMSNCCRTYQVIIDLVPMCFELWH